MWGAGVERTNVNANKEKKQRQQRRRTVLAEVGQSLLLSEFALTEENPAGGQAAPRSVSRGACRAFGGLARRRARGSGACGAPGQPDLSEGSEVVPCRAR